MEKIIKPNSQGCWDTVTGPGWISLLPPFSSVPSHSTYFYSIHKQPKFKTKNSITWFHCTKPPVICVIFGTKSKILTRVCKTLNDPILGFLAHLFPPLWMFFPGCPDGSISFLPFKSALNVTCSYKFCLVSSTYFQQHWSVTSTILCFYLFVNFCFSYQKILTNPWEQGLYVSHLCISSTKHGA